jgi:hypothetical protein
MYWHQPKLENGPVENMVFNMVFGSIFVFWSKKTKEMAVTVNEKNGKRIAGT